MALLECIKNNSIQQWWKDDALLNTLYTELDVINSSEFFVFGSFKDCIESLNVILSGPKMENRLSNGFYSLCFPKDISDHHFYQKLVGRGNFIVILRMKNGDVNYYDKLSYQHHLEWKLFFPSTSPLDSNKTLFLPCLDPPTSKGSKVIYALPRDPPDLDSLINEEDQRISNLFSYQDKNNYTLLSSNSTDDLMLHQGQNVCYLRQLKILLPDPYWLRETKLSADEVPYKLNKDFVNSISHLAGFKKMEYVQNNDNIQLQIYFTQVCIRSFTDRFKRLIKRRKKSKNDIVNWDKIHPSLFAFVEVPKVCALVEESKGRG